MRIRLLSDLHLEYCLWEPPKVEADVVVLAGDIHNGLAGIRWAAEQFACRLSMYLAITNTMGMTSSSCANAGAHRNGLITSMC